MAHLHLNDVNYYLPNPVSDTTVAVDNMQTTVTILGAWMS